MLITNFGSIASQKVGFSGGIDAYTKSMLHFNGADGSATFTDQMGKIWTPHGNAQLDTSYKVFGTASGLFDGLSWIDTPDSEDFNFGSGDWTIDYRQKLNVIGITQYVFGQSDSGLNQANSSIFIRGQVSNNMQALVYYGSSALSVTASIQITDSNWHHVALVRSRDTLIMFIDKVPVGTTYIGDITINNSPNKFAIGRCGEYVNNYFNGAIDEFRMQNGVAEWVSEFILPTGEYVSEATANTLSYYGTISGLAVARFNMSAASVGNYALFTGGNDANSASQSAVDAYNTSLAKSSPTSLSVARSQGAGTSNNSYALFAGGYVISPSTVEVDVVDAYNSSLTRSLPTALSQAKRLMGSASNGNYAVFAGGYINGSYINTVETYDTALTRTVISSLGEARYAPGSCYNGVYTMFAGGYGVNGRSSYVDAYNSSLVHTTAASLRVGRNSLGAARAGNYALFGGGYSTLGTADLVDAYSASLVRISVTGLSVARYNLTATSVGEYALFCGGTIDPVSSAADAYNANLVYTMASNLFSARYNLSAASVGNYAIFAGGITMASPVTGTANVEVYRIT